MVGERDAAGSLLDARLFLVLELLVQARKAAGKRADGIFVAAPIITPMARSFSGTEAW